MGGKAGIKEPKKRGVTITIDGPAGSGKSTVSKMLARRLNFLYLDTGAMYRAVAFRAEKEGFRLEDDEALEKFCRGVQISFAGSNENQRVLCQGEDVTEKIREPRIGWLASTVSMKAPVRQAMLRLQREIGAQGRIVAEGRDTGTVVFPGAEFKFFLTAEPEERARRRHREFMARGASIRAEEVEREIKERDEQDSSRELAPLRPAADAHFIDSTCLKPEEVVEKMWQVIKKKGKRHPQRRSEK